jgi:hypothetical protein
MKGLLANEKAQAAAAHEYKAGKFSTIHEMEQKKHPSQAK